MVVLFVELLGLCKMLVKEILAKKHGRIITILPDAKMGDAVRIMATEKIGTILLVDREDQLKGIFSERDLVRIIATHGAEAREFPVGELATTSVITCTEDNTLEDVLTMMSNSSIRHLPVTRDQRLVGMISARDLMDAQKDNLLAVLARQKQAAALMGRAKNQAEQANRTKTEFLSRMSHELRTPLNSIIGFSDIIQSQKLGNIANSNYVDYACEIHKSGSQLLALIDDILSLTRLESGKRQLQDAALDPAQHVSACLDRFADDGRAKNIKIDALLPDDDVRLTADAEMLIRMLDNLVSNAIKFTPDGGRITVDVGLDKAKALLVSVADTGIGINPDALESVLTPFSQAEKLLERNFEGTGLGLALVKMMIEMHEGSLVLKSDLGVGTTITLRFPADRVQIEGTRRAAAL